MVLLPQNRLNNRLVNLHLSHPVFPHQCPRRNLLRNLLDFLLLNQLPSPQHNQQDFLLVSHPTFLLGNPPRFLQVSRPYFPLVSLHQFHHASQAADLPFNRMRSLQINQHQSHRLNLLDSLLHNHPCSRVTSLPHNPQPNLLLSQRAFPQ